MYECTGWKKKKKEEKKKNIEKNSETLPRYLTEKKEFYIRKKFPRTKEKGEQFNEHTCATYGGARGGGGEVNGHEGKSSSNRFRENQGSHENRGHIAALEFETMACWSGRVHAFPFFSFVSPLLPPLPRVASHFLPTAVRPYHAGTLAARRFPSSIIFEYPSWLIPPLSSPRFLALSNFPPDPLSLPVIVYDSPHFQNSLSLQPFFHLHHLLSFVISTFHRHFLAGILLLIFCLSFFFVPPFSSMPISRELYRLYRFVLPRASLILTPLRQQLVRGP